jgi:Domain of unknown function (DUF1929)
VHPLSASLSPTLAQFWITQNFAPTDPNAPPAPQSGMNTVHVSLIPSGVHRGEVLVLDGNLTNHGTRAYQPWSIVNPYWPAPNPNYWTPPPGPPPPQYRFHNGLIPMPPGEGELFCAGHCWLPDGRLLLAGGTKRYPIQTQGLWEGGRLIYQWDHVVTLPGYPFGRWYQMPSNLEAFRWYPTVRVDGTRDWRAIVIGGSHWTAGSSIEEQQVNSYESVRWAAFNAPAIPALLPPPQDFDRKLVPSQPNWPASIATPLASSRQYWGPHVPIPNPLSTTGYQAFREYPRLHALGILDPISNGGTAPRLFHSGQPLWGMHWAHDSDYDPVFGVTTAGAGYNIGQNPAFGDITWLYGTSLLMPSPVGGLSTMVARIGGTRGLVTGPSKYVETVQTNIAATQQSSWSLSMPAMRNPRTHLNVVMMRSGDLLAIGGEGPPGVFHRIPELLPSGGTAWAELAPHAGPRDYHSTALLLPDGRVFVAGGENRKNGAFPGPDYLIYEPPYFSLDYGSVPPAGIVVTNASTTQLVEQDEIGPLGMQYGTDYRATWTNTLEDGITVAGVVLVAPSSVTHHDDGGQRVVRLSIRYDDDQAGQPANAIKFRSPANERVAPPGWWMLFLVTTSGRPSQAYWVHLL